MTDLSLQGVSVRYGRGRRAELAVREVDLAIPSGRTLGLVGESGSGKSSLARAVGGLVPTSGGDILLGGRDVSMLRRPGRPSPIQLIFQNSAAALNPRMTAGQSIGEALEGRGIRGRAAAGLVDHHLDLVGLDTSRRDLRPDQLSGGQKQRVAIARVLAAEPQVIVADEITSALDVSVQAAILNLVAALQGKLGFTLLFISHNLAAVRYLSDTIAVMHRGRIVESGPTLQVTGDPSHDYTRSLLDAVLPLNPAVTPRARPEGPAFE